MVRLTRPMGAVLAVALLAAPGCGGSQQSATSDVMHHDGSQAGSVLPQDQTFTLAEIDVPGVAFSPEAIGLPSMPRVTSHSHVSLEHQRRKVARKATPDDVQLLASMLWQAADEAAASDPSKARGLRDEARRNLAKLQAARGDKTSDVTLHMLAVADQWLGDSVQAIAAYHQLVTRFPTHEGLRSFQTWLAQLYLGRHQVEDAAQLVKGWKPEELGDLSSYVLAWVSFASGDSATARAAIVQAIQKWRDASTRPILERDLVLILSRTGTPVAEATKLIAQALGEDQVQPRYVATFKLSEAYRFAGRYDQAGAALDSIVDDLVKGEMPPDDLVSFRFRQADYAFRQNQPVLAAKLAIEAHKALSACGGKCSDETAEAVAERVLKLAQFSHTVFAKSQDPRHYQAARTLYEYYLTIPGRSDRETARGYLRSLEQTKRSADPNAGKHDTEVMHNMVLARREVLAACYEDALLSEPTLSGNVKLILAVDQSGAVAGVESDPGAGEKGLARVARCAAEAAQSWTFPSRTVPGRTTMTVPAVFHLQEDEQAAPPKAAPPKAAPPKAAPPKAAPSAGG